MLKLMACGDVAVKRSDCDSIFAGCRSVLKAADVCFGQLEAPISDRGAKVPNARLAMRAPPSMAGAARQAGFNVMSFAGNHCLDYGYDAFEDTFTHAQQAGILLCGAGPNLNAASQPAVLQVRGESLAVLAACSILPEGYAAGRDNAGCVPLRAHTVYEPIEPDQPGTGARIRTSPYTQDLDALVRAVRKADATYDYVVVSLHWGIHMVKGSIADYQRAAAHALIDAGARAILGHHPHLLKGIEIYRGSPIFYSLGNFAIEQPYVWDPRITQTAGFKHLQSLNPTWALDGAYTLPPDTRWSVIARLELNGSQTRTLLRPVWIDDDSAPVVLSPPDPRFTGVAEFLRQAQAAADLHTGIEAQGAELTLTS